MTVRQLAEALQLKTVACPQPDRRINGCYIGDLLSWVMGRAEADQAWITIMSNVNIVAVSTLADPACIILSEGVEPDPEAKARAEIEGVNILSTDLDTFNACVKIAELI